MRLEILPQADRNKLKVAQELPWNNPFFVIFNMSEKLNFMQDRISALPLPVNNDRSDFYDTRCPKLICRVSNNGSKSFVVMKKR